MPVHFVVCVLTGFSCPASLFVVGDSGCMAASVLFQKAHEDTYRVVVVCFLQSYKGGGNGCVGAGRVAVWEQQKCVCLGWWRGEELCVCCVMCGTCLCPSPSLVWL